MTTARHRPRWSRTTRICLLVALMASMLTAVVAGEFPAAAESTDPRIITTVAGGGACCDPRDGGPATGAWLRYPAAAVPDGAGNVYIAESSGHRVRKVDPARTIEIVAGTGEQGYSGDGGNATSA